MTGRTRAASRRSRTTAALLPWSVPLALVGASATLGVEGCAPPPTAVQGQATDCASRAHDDPWTPPAGAESDPDWATLIDNALYPAELPDLTGCPAPATAATMSGLEAQATRQLDCVQDAWRPLLESAGLDAAEIPLHVYPGEHADTPCGTISCPAVYCAEDGGGIWLGEASLDSATWFALGIKGVVNHEYAHHLQSLIGVLDAQHRIGATSESVRRVELQATCLGYAMIAHDDRVADHLDLVESSDPLLGSLLADDVHGSRDSVAQWALTGLDARTLGDCNTWLAAAGAVS